MLGHDFNSWGVETRRGSIPPLRRLVFGPRLWQVTWRVPGPSHGHLTVAEQSQLDVPMASAALRVWCGRCSRGHIADMLTDRLGSFARKEHRLEHFSSCQKAAWSSGMILA